MNETIKNTNEMGEISEERYNQVDNLYNLAEKSLASEMFDKAKEYCDKIHELDANNYKAWWLMCKIEGTSFLRCIPEFIDLENIRQSLSNDSFALQLKDIVTKLKEINTRTFNCANTAFSCADDNQKNELLNMLTELAVSHVSLLISGKLGTGNVQKLIMELPQDSFFDFLKNHYDEKIAAKQIDEYICAVFGQFEKNPRILEIDGLTILESILKKNRRKFCCRIPRESCF